MPALWTKTFSDQAKKLRLPSQDHRATRLAAAKAQRRREAKPCRRVSKKRAREQAIYDRLRPVFLKDNPWCERCLASGIKVPSTDLHHWAGRGRNFIVEKYFRAACNPCNLYAREHPLEAIEEGWRAPVGIYATQ